MNTDKTVAIVAPDPSERKALNELLVEEGFAVEAFCHPEEFVNNINSSPQGCLIVDLDHSRDDPHKQSLVNLATRCSREMPTIVIASDPPRLPQDPLLPTISKAAGESHLLYLLYGALSEPTRANNPQM